MIAMVVFNFDGILSEFRELFQKIALVVEDVFNVCRNCQNLDLKFCKFSETESVTKKGTA